MSETSTEAIESHSDSEVTSDDGTTQVENFSASLIGCPMASPVWDYFIFNKTKDKNVCQCILKDVKEPSSSTSGTVKKKCETAMTSKFMTNRKAHLQKFHPSNYQRKKRRERKPETATLCRSSKD